MEKKVQKRLKEPLHSLMRGLFGTLLFLFMVQFQTLSASQTGKQTVQLSNLKATYLLHGLKYIRWEAENLPNSETPVQLLVIGEDKNNFKSRIEYLVNASNFKIEGRSVVIKSISSWEQGSPKIGKNGATIGFLLDSESATWQKADYPNIPGTLMIGENESFLRRGMVLCFRKDNNRLKISVNLKKASSMNLTVSSELLALFRIISED